MKTFMQFMWLVLAALLMWFVIIEPRIQQPQPPVILAGPTQSVAIYPTPMTDNIPATQFVQTWEVYQEQFEPTIQVIELPQGTQTPGPTLNEYMGATPGGNMFEGEVQLP